MESRKIAEKVWLDIYNNDTLIYNTFEEYWLAEFNKQNIMEKDVYTYDFNDWVNEMLNQSDYTELELLEFKEHYQNLLDDDQNAENFLNYKNLI
jgi:hypothetical protein